MCSTLKQITSK